MVSFLINKFTVMIVISTILAGIMMFPLVEGNRSSYGEFCNKTQRCESGVSLICRNELCECIKPDTMTYDTISNSCVVLVGEKCKYGIESIDEGGIEYDEYTGYSSNSQKVRYEYDNCVINATCNAAGVCACKKYNFESSNGTCIESRGFYKSCEDTKQCRTDLYLTCINGTCQCDPTTSIDIEFGTSGSGLHRCTGLAGKPCVNGYCVKHSRCIHKRCECEESYIPSQKDGGFCDAIDYSGRCGPRYNTIECHSNFTCLNGVCRCKYDGENQFYDTNLKICRSFVWGPCDLNGDDVQCDNRAECVADKKTGFPECRCKAPYIENKERACEYLKFGSHCDQDYSSPSCDQMVPLFCRDGKCDCEDKLKIYDPKERKCRRLVGSICKNTYSCVENAICKKPYNSEHFEQYGKCECIPSKIPSINRTCELNNLEDQKWNVEKAIEEG